MQQRTRNTALTRCALAGLSGLLFGSALLAAVPAEACTSFVLPTAGGSRIYARTMEFAVDMKSQMTGIPRGFRVTATAPDDGGAMTWTGKYAAVGMNAFGLPALLDGVNEKGLAGGVLYFPGFAQYAPWQAAAREKSLAPWEVLTWALTNFATVDEVKAALKDVVVAGVTQKDMGMVPDLHYTLHDASGASIVIEPVDGRLKVYDNPLGVMTNAPSFDWHLVNLRNYVNLRPKDVDTLKINGYTIHAFGTGSGMHGIPGDASPPSRFVRAAAYVLAVGSVPDGADGVRVAEHIENNFDIPKGMVQEQGMPPEFTQWTGFADLKNDTYYIKTWDAPVLHSVSFRDFDVNGGKMVTFAIPASEPAALKPES